MVIKEYNEKRDPIVIIRNNLYAKYLYLHCFPEKYFSELDEFFSYHLPSGNFVTNDWDGIIHLIKRFDDKIALPKGFLQKFQFFCQERKIKYLYYEKERKYKKYDFRYQGPILWDHQKKALDILLQNKLGIVQIATGGGKSVLMAKLIAERNVQTNIFIDSVDVGYQLQETFKSCLNVEVGFIGDSICNIVDGINVILLPTAYLALLATGKIKRYEYINKEYKIRSITLDSQKYDAITRCILSGVQSLFDEVDTIGAITYSLVVKCLQSMFIHGFSATPWRNDGKDLEIEAGCGPFLYQLSASQLIEKKILVPPTIYLFNIDYTISPLPRNYPSIYKKCLVENAHRNNLILRLTKELVQKKLTGILIVKRIKHGKLLSKMLTKAGIYNEFVHGKHAIATRKKFLQLLAKRDLPVIISTLFSRGTNIPSLDFIIRCKGEGKTLTNKPNTDVLQMVGRALRSAKNKKDAIIIDFYDPYHYLIDHSKARIFTYESEPSFKLVFKKHGSIFS